MVIDYIFGVVGVYQTIIGTTILPKIGWGIVLFCAFAIPPLIAFHRMRKQRDELKAENANLKKSIEDEQSKHRPTFIMADSEVEQDTDKKAKRMVIKAMVGFMNSGDKPAYQVEINRCYAAVETPSKIEIQPIIKNPNPVNSGEKIYVPFVASQPLTKPDTVASTAMLIYCNLRYSDTLTKGNWFEYEKWLVYPINHGALAFMKPEQKQSFEPIVRKALTISQRSK